jgi:hypothetical protein
MTEQDRMQEALKFIGSIAGEELQYAKVGTGAEVALRHIRRKVEEALANLSHTQPAPDLSYEKSMSETNREDLERLRTAPTSQPAPEIELKKMCPWCRNAYLPSVGHTCSTSDIAPILPAPASQPAQTSDDFDKWYTTLPITGEESCYDLASQAWNAALAAERQAHESKVDELNGIIGGHAETIFKLRDQVREAEDATNGMLGMSNHIVELEAQLAAAASHEQAEVDRLNGMIDIMNRELEHDEEALLANDYGGTKWEQTPEVEKHRKLHLAHHDHEQAAVEAAYKRGRNEALRVNESAIQRSDEK